MPEPSDISGLVAWFDAADLSTLFQDTAGTTPVASAGDTVARWNDKSGGGFNLTQATAANQPTYVPSVFGGGVKFGTVKRWLNNAAFSQAQPYTIALYFYTPSYNNKDDTAAVFPHVLIGGSNTAGQFGHFWEQANNGALDDISTYRWYAGTSSGDFGYASSVGRLMIGVYNGASSLQKIDRNDTASADVGSNTKSQLAFGNHSNGSILQSQGIICKVAIWNKALSAGEIEQVRAMWFDTDGKNVLVCDGDSITRGARSTYYGDYPFQLAALKPEGYDWHLFNRGISSQTTALALATVTDVDGYYNADAARIFYLAQFGANDLATGVSLATLQTNIQTLCSGRRTLGYKVIVGTLLPHNVTSNFTEANFNSYNSWLIANWSSFADGIADFTSHVMGQWLGNQNATYFNADQIHPNDTGYGVMAGIWKTAIEALLVAPAITSQPSSATKDAGESVTFSVTATGNPAVTYQWRKDGVNIGGATSADYTIPSVAEADAGDYDVVVTNSEGSATSNVATLTVNSATSNWWITGFRLWRRR